MHGDRIQPGQSGKEFSDVAKKEPEKYNSKHPMQAVATLGSNDYALVLDDKEAKMGYAYYRPTASKVPQYLSKLVNVQLQMSLVGSAGEICDDMRVEGRQPGTSEFTMTDPDGKVVESGNFEYG